MTRGPDAGTVFARALVTSAREGGVIAEIKLLSSRPYASATFTGSTERIALSATANPPLDAWLADLAEADLPMRRHVVGTLAITDDVRTGGSARLIVEALVLDKD